MIKPHRMASIALFSWALWHAPVAAGQEPADGACEDCPAVGANRAPLPTSPPPLFTHASNATPLDLMEPSPVPASVAHGPSRPVQIDFAQLSQAHEALAEGRGAALTLNLSEKLSVSASLTSASETRQGYALSGHLVNDPLSAVNIVVNGRTVVGNIRRAGKLHTIRTAGAAYLVQTLDGEHTGPLCEVEHSDEFVLDAAPLMHSPVIAQNDGAADDGTVIDVMVVYTQAGRRSAGGHRGIRTLIDMLVLETNQAYRDSDVHQRIRLVAATEVDYELQDFSIHETLGHLTETADGHMDEVHRIRDLHAADLVLLFRPFGGGTAWLVAEPSATTAESRAFSVSNWHTFTHELGHSMGLRHHRANDAGNTPYPYSHGYVFRHDGNAYATIMATSQGLLRFSNPHQRFPNNLGVPLGVPGDAPSRDPNGPADAARSLNNTAAAVANFRSSATGCHYDLPSPSDMAAEGGASVISFTTSAECPWDAKSLSPALSITEGFIGTGDGQVAFTVEQNLGLSRELALRVAGNVYAFHQEGGRQPVSVCDRSSSAREAISGALNNLPCADVTAEDLAGIGSLNINGGVSLGDFDGMTGLGSLVLRLYYGGLVPRLDEGIFAGVGLESLHQLSVLADATRTLHLRQGAFEGLDGLGELFLSDVSWAPGVFEDLPSLKVLKFSRYPQETLPDGAFLGLDKLTQLVSLRGKFETVGSRAFQGLSSLQDLQLRDGHLAHLPSGAFADLPKLVGIALPRNRLRVLRRDQFRGAPALWWFDLEDNPIHVIDSGAFGGVPVRYLNLRNADLMSLGADVFDVLLDCTLDLSGNRLNRLDEGIFAGARFFRLDVSNNYLSDLSFLSALSYAREIDLSGNRVDDISPLASVGGLTTLNLSNNEIVDVSPLAGLSQQLIHLDVSRNKIGHISPLSASGELLGEGSMLYLQSNPLVDDLEEHLAILRSRGVVVYHIRVWPLDSSAFEGDELEFAVRLSSDVSNSVSLDWQLIVAEEPDRRTVLSNFLLTATRPDIDWSDWGCGYGICDVGVGGELTIIAGSPAGYATVLEVIEDNRSAEGHETLALVLFPHTSGFPSGVALDGAFPALQRIFGEERQSVAAGLIVDPAGPSYDVPLFLTHGDARGRQSFLRLVSPMDGSPMHVEAFGDSGGSGGSTTLSTRHGLSSRPDPSRSAVAHFNSEDLERGNYDKGLSKGVGPGNSDWCLKVWANDVQALSYVRMSDGFLTSLHDVVRREADGTYAVPIFNPASNTRQRSILRLMNVGTEAGEVRIVGMDDTGARPGGTVGLNMEPGSVRELSALDLESGTPDLRGSLGNGQGRWRLSVVSDQPLLVVNLLESPTGHLTNLSTVPDNSELGAGGVTTHHVPLFLSAGDERGWQSFVRVVNKGEATAAVRIRPFDDTTRDYGSVALTVAAGEVAHFNSHHLEVGGAGLSEGVGAGEGDWRLELETTEDIDVLTYVRHADGFLTSMHDVVSATPDGRVVPIFNPASNTRQRSTLRLVNPRGEDAEVTIRGIDDRGVTRGTVSLAVPAGRSRVLSAQEMEAGRDAFEGSLGDGEGKWRLVVQSDVDIQVMSLLEGAAGHLTNLSTVPQPVEGQ